MTAFSMLCDRPFLVAQFPAPQQMLSWSLTRPGFITADKVAWLEVSEADLPLGVDPGELLERRLEEAGHGQSVHLMTSRDVRKHHLRFGLSGAVTATCVATVGLANSGRVGEAFQTASSAGTINLLAHVDRPLSTAALIEALSIATQARTAAVMDLGWRRDGKVVTGTGTDCIVVAAPDLAGGEIFAGLHTDIGVALGRAVYDAVRSGGEEWVGEKTVSASNDLSVSGMDGRRS